MSTSRQNAQVPEESPGSDLVSQSDMDFYKTLGAGAIGDLGTQDVIMPRYRIIQNTSHTGSPGKIVSNTSPDKEYDFINMIIFKFSRNRVMFPEVGQGDRPQCRSNDGYHKSDPSGIGDGDCSNCRYNVWGKDAQGRPIKPRCQEGYSYLGHILFEDGSVEPAVFSTKGTGIKPAKMFNTAMSLRNVAPFAYVTQIGTEGKTNDKGRFFIPTFTFGEWLPRDRAILAAEQFVAYNQSDSIANAMVDDTDGYTPVASPRAEDLNRELEYDINALHDDIPF